MREGELFNEWLAQTLPDIRTCIPDAEVTVLYSDPGLYELIIEDSKQHPISFIVVCTDTGCALRSVVVQVAINHINQQSVSEILRGANHMTIHEVLTIARAMQEEYRAKPQ